MNVMEVQIGLNVILFLYYFTWTEKVYLFYLGGNKKRRERANYESFELLQVNNGQ